MGSASTRLPRRRSVSDPGKNDAKTTEAPEGFTFTIVDTPERANKQSFEKQGGSWSRRHDRRVSAKYELKKQLNKGKFSRVLLVQDRVTKKDYAIKVLDYKGGRELANAELAILHRVHHPNVVRLVEAFEGRHRLYMVMELARGGDLLDRLLSRVRFTEKESMGAVRMLMAALQYLHSLGITHRDVKPDNLLYSHPADNAPLLLSDFGFAALRSPSPNSFMHTACGTPEYVAPEVIAGHPYTNAVDMWSSGVVLYMLLSGSFPFADDNTLQLYAKILKADYPMDHEPWPSLSPGARYLVTSLLSCEPELRPSASEVLQHPWTCGKPFRAPPQNKNAAQDIPEKSMLDDQQNVARQIRKSARVSLRQQANNDCLKPARSPEATSIHSTSLRRVWLNDLKKIRKDPMFLGLSCASCSANNTVIPYTNMAAATSNEKSDSKGHPESCITLH